VAEDSPVAGKQAVLEQMHSALLDALRHREQEIFSYLAILVPALGGFMWLLLHLHSAGADKPDVNDDDFFVGTLGVLMLLFLGAAYSLTLGYNFRYVTLQLAKIEHHLKAVNAILRGWPRSPADFKSRYRLLGVPWCAPPEMIRVFWVSFLAGIVGVSAVYWNAPKNPHRCLVIWAGGICFVIGLLGPFWFGCKLRRLICREGNQWH